MDPQPKGSLVRRRLVLAPVRPTKSENRFQISLYAEAAQTIVEVDFEFRLVTSVNRSIKEIVN
jgi:hypothetical protein